MRKTRVVCRATKNWRFLAVVPIMLSVVVAVGAQELRWEGTMAEAVEQARNEGKLIVLVAGRDTCPNTTWMRASAKQMAAENPRIAASYVWWYCQVDHSGDWWTYAQGMSSILLPLICVLDPADMRDYLDRSTGVQGTCVDRLATHLLVSPCAVRAIAGPRRLLRWTSEQGATYRLQRSLDLRQWDYVSTALMGTGSELGCDDGPVQAATFYRLIGFRQ